MDSKRSSLDDGSSTASSLRRWARTPTAQLLGLKRSGASSPSSASIHSVESERTSLCVAGEAVKGECAWHRFFIWAATKRNTHANIPDDERTRCPLWDCRERCSNYEAMLRHLNACPHRIDGGYRCYGCDKMANFNDAKSRCQCLGGNGEYPPSRRRRIMSMARSVFSSLGRPKPAALSALTVDADDSSAEDDEPRELHSNPIHEIDSGGVLSMIPEYAACAEFDADSGCVSRSSSSASNPFAGFVYGQCPNRHASVASYGSSVSHWESPATVPTVAPGDLTLEADVEAHQAYSSRRSKALQPSSSVRSTTSTVSTVSTVSTSSTSTTHTTSTAASCDISPDAEFFDIWGQVPLVVSDFACPVDDLSMSANLASPSSLLPQQQNFGGCGMDLDQFFDTSILAELPADLPADLPVSFADATDNAMVNDDPEMDLFSQPAPHQSNDNGDVEGSQFDKKKTHMGGSHRATAHSLLQSAQDMLALHISQSASRLGSIRQNSLARQFCNMSTRAVASAGLETMEQILQGQQPASPVKLVCFVHLIYSLSLLLHEQDSQKRLSDVFIQAISYNSWLPRRDRLAYIRVVDYLWKPNEMADDELLRLINTNASPSASVLVDFSLNSGRDLRRDPLVTTSQNFLDVLEYAALRETKRANIQSSEVCIEHQKAVKLNANLSWSFRLAASCVIMSLSQRYSSAISLNSELQDVSNKVATGRISTIRRLELELMHSGKDHLTPEAYFDDFVSHVRDQIDGLQSQSGLMSNLRTKYHRLDITLMASEMLLRDGEGAITPPKLRIADTNSGADRSQPRSDALSPPILGSPIYKTSSNATESIPSPSDGSAWLSSTANSTPAGHETSTASSSPSTTSTCKTEVDISCDICGYRPKGDPKWFAGSVARHKKLQHAGSPPKIYACLYPGCSSKYKNRPDNLKQHQIEKGHFIDGEEGPPKGRKRKKIE